MSVIPKISDISHFFEKNSRGDNALTNQIRENILATIIDIPESYLKDETYGEKWNTVRDLFELSLKLVCPVKYYRIEIKQKGGMSHNYDFDIDYLDNLGNKVYNKKVEFKNNNTKLTKLPQFLELYDNECKEKYDMFAYSYAEFYYDNYLDDYLKVDNLSIEKPEKAVYLQKVKDIKYSHPFFNQIYVNRDNKKKQKEEIVNESKQMFLELYANEFNFNKLTTKIRESQTNKVYLLWDCEEEGFSFEELDIRTIAITGIKPGTIKKMCFDVNVDNFTYNIQVRLNWGNNNGIANPRWKFTFINK